MKAAFCGGKTTVTITRKLLAAALIALFCLNHPAQAGDAPAPASQQNLDLTYDVYAGGFKALHAVYQAQFDAQAYDIDLKTATQGFIGTIFPWRGIYKTAGHTAKDREIPDQHTARSIWRKKEKVTELSYAPDGTLLKFTTQENGKTNVKRDIKKELSEDAVDLLTGTLMLIQHAPAEGVCDRSFIVFDGKRRYSMTLAGGEMDTIKKSDYSLFAGPALKCTLTVKPLAGFREKDQKRGWMAVQNHTMARKKPPTIWFGRLKQDGPVLPVRMEINSDYGAAVAHLSASK